MTEPDVALTDYLLALESLVLATWLIGEPYTRPDLRLWSVVFFAATGLASVLGGTVHGFFTAAPSPLGTVLWRSTLIAIGVAAAAVWMLGAGLLWREAHARVILAIVAVEFVAYAAAVAAGHDSFLVAIVNYLPPVGLLLVAYWATYRSNPNGAVAIGLAGLVLSLVAALGQQLRISIHPVYFNHNALYHALQGIALFMVFWSGRYLIRA